MNSPSRIQGDVLAAGASPGSLLVVVNALLRHYKRIAAFAIAGLALAVIVTFVLGAWWESASTFMPESRRLPSALSGLAASLGVDVAAGEGTTSPAFYADLATSTEILGMLADSPFAIVDKADTTRGTLPLLWDTRGSTPALQREEAIRLLRKYVHASPNTKTGVVRLTVQDREPQLAYQINVRLLSLLDEFNMKRRRSQAGARRRFAEEQVNNARDELRRAEDRLQQFVQGNREYSRSSMLTFEQERLQRDISMRQQLYTTLMQEFDAAKIEEVRDTPIITIVESPRIPVRHESRGLILKGLIGLFAGAAVAMLLAMWRDGMDRMVLDTEPAAREFETLVGQLRTDWRRGMQRLMPPRNPG